VTIIHDTATRTDPVETAYSSVLVPLDGSQHAEQALRAGWMLARCFDARLHVVAVGASRAERCWYEDYLDRLDPGPGLAPRHLADAGDVPGGILATAHDLAPCLLCMETHGRSRLAPVTGSTFAAVAARATRPLVVVGPNVDRRRDTIDRLAVCLDGTPAAETALRVAVAWARRLGASVSLLTVARPALAYDKPEWDLAATGRYLPDGDPESYLAAVTCRSELAQLSVDARILWSRSAPHVAIGDHLDHEPGTLAVATTHGRTGLARAALGSDVARIVHRSPAPVLVVPPHASR
jgi:nucleotide-binding universal stress UspA family protein